MKYIILIMFAILQLNASVVKVPLVGVDLQNNQVSVKVDNIDVGLSGFIVHKISKEHSVILKNAVVDSFDASTKIATLKVSDYDALRNNSLPSGKWSVSVGDTAVLAFGYTRGLLIAPNEDIHYRIKKSVKNLQWIHPDLFATVLSFNGHPSPLREDFKEFSISTSVGLVFIYIDQKVFTIDAKSFKILSISDAKLKQDTTKLPFYTRVQKIETSWWKLWGDGVNEVKAYEPYYYQMLLDANPNNQELKKLINNFNLKASK
ncbi:MAG: hypothetical protein GXO30_06160 [Epsilonproteobacteria bacterium]|nr:hypothetical protein [Campylobacterota bacterium]